MGNNIEGSILDALFIYVYTYILFILLISVVFIFNDFYEYLISITAAVHFTDTHKFFMVFSTDPA